MTAGTINNFVDLVGTELKVDVDGTGGGAAFVTVATFGAPLSSALVLFDDILPAATIT